ncbi:hypothetical protein JCM11641_006115 [Rhodosporidiobolus odoratus]
MADQEQDSFFPPDDELERALLDLDTSSLTHAASSAAIDSRGTKRTVTDRVHAQEPTQSASSASAQEEKDYRDAAQYEALNFGDIGIYLRNKRAKLQVQNEALLEGEGEKPQIFKNLAVYINGFTEGISLPELQHLLVLHGGVYVPYLDKKALVTHIIASNLTPSKKKEFAAYQVATSDWLVDSAREGRLKNWKEYALLAAPRTEDRVMVATDEHNPNGMQTAQRSLFAMMGPRGGGTRKPEPAPASPKKVETRESLSARGARLAKEALIAQGHGSASSSTAKKFFHPRRSAVRPDPPRPTTVNSQATASMEPPRATVSSPRATSPSRPSLPSRPATPSCRANLPATTDSPQAPTEGSRSWLPQAQRSEKQSALLQDPEWLAKHTSASEDFLAGYFAQSRLHHLSSFKEELKLLVSRYYTEHPPPALQKGKKQKKLTGTAADGRTVMHCDLDCFFVSAGLTTRPELRRKPLAVCHARGKDGAEASTSEIASCSYEAREKGVKNGMSLGRGRELCPNLQTIPFEFDHYKAISLKFYEILLSHATFLQVGSMDEVLFEVSAPPAIAPDSSPALALANQIREEIFAATGCPASIGVSHNILLARLATRKAKPAGAFHLLSDHVLAFLAPLDVDALPGIGWKQSDKLESELGVRTVGDLLKKNKYDLERALGKKNAETYAAFARGVDARELENGKARQSVSAEVNYGIRFGEGRYDQVERFIRQLATETTKRLVEQGLKARQITLKIMVRHPEAPVDAPKMLGHGWTNDETKSSALAPASDDSAAIADIAWKLVKNMQNPPHELRGIGIQLQKLEKDGVPVDAVLEKGQGKLSFAPAPRKSTLAPPPPLPATEQLQPSRHEIERTPSPALPAKGVDAAEEPHPAQFRPPPSPPRLAERPLEIVLDSSSDDEPSPCPASPAPPDRAAQHRGGRPAAPSEPYIPSMFRQSKPSVAPSTAASISEKELKKLNIDVEYYHGLPLQMQREVVAQQRRRLPAKVAKPNNGKGRALSPPVTDLTLSSSPSTSSAEASAGPSVVVLPPTPIPAAPSDTQAVRANLGDAWDALGSRTQKQQIKLYKQLQSLTVRNPVRASSSTRPTAPVKDVAIRLEPRFSRQSELGEICDRIEQWVGASKEDGPDSKDLDALGRYVEKCAQRDNGHDLKKATDVLSWWECVLEGEYGSRKGAEQVDGTGRVWWESYEQVKQRLDWVVLKETGCRLKL